jgi:hypothetical protein
MEFSAEVFLHSAIPNHHIWDKMLTYYDKRLAYHVREFVDYLQNKTAWRELSATTEDGHPIHKVSELYHCSKKYVCGERNSIGPIVDLAYDLRRDQHLQTWLCSQASIEWTNKLLRLLGFVGRLRAAYWTFIEVADRISSFQNVQFELLKGFPPKVVESSLQLTFGAVELLSTTKRVSTGSLDRNGFQEKLRKLYSKEIWVHAEIRMLYYFLSGDQAFDPFQYLGSSKRTCFLCGQFLKGIGKFATRGNRGKMYSQWTLPGSFKLHEKYLASAQHSLHDLQHTLREQVSQKIRKGVKMQPESSFGISTCLDVKHGTPYQTATGLGTLLRENKWLESLSGREDRTRYENFSNYITFCFHLRLTEANQRRQQSFLQRASLQLMY